LVRFVESFREWRRNGCLAGMNKGAVVGRGGGEGEVGE